MFKEGQQKTNQNQKRSKRVLVQVDKTQPSGFGSDFVFNSDVPNTSITGFGLIFVIIKKLKKYVTNTKVNVSEYSKNNAVYVVLLNQKKNVTLIVIL